MTDREIEALSRPLPKDARDILDEDEIRWVYARRIFQHGYYEPRAGLDQVKLAKAHRTLEQGQRDPIRITVGTNGRYEIYDGRHRLRAGIADDLIVKVQFERGGASIGTNLDNLIFRRGYTT